MATEESPTIEDSVTDVYLVAVLSSATGVDFNIFVSCTDLILVAEGTITEGRV